MKLLKDVMRKIFSLLLLCLVSLTAMAQELTCTVTVNSDQLSQGDLQVFKTLERSLNDFMNKSKWTNRVYKENERINAQMFITITEYESRPEQVARIQLGQDQLR